MRQYEWLARFAADFDRLSPARQAMFLPAVVAFVEDLGSGAGFRKGLRVKGVEGAAGVFEMTGATLDARPANTAMPCAKASRMSSGAAPGPIRCSGSRRAVERV